MNSDAQFSDRSDNQSPPTSGDGANAEVSTAVAAEDENTAQSARADVSPEAVVRERFCV